jgi:hypothetical protein
MNQALKKFPKKKIILGLVITGMLLIFVGVGFSADEPANANKSATAPSAQVPAPATPAPLAQPKPVADPFTPELATQFVKWWSAKSMNYTAASAKADHDEAFKWMSPEAVQAFQSCFWTPGIEQEVLMGHVGAAFQPVSVQAEAINPDGSIVVALNGTLVMQAPGTAPVTQQIAVDYLVKKDDQGLRISGLYNRTTVAPAAY